MKALRFLTRFIGEKQKGLFLSVFLLWLVFAVPTILGIEGYSNPFVFSLKVTPQNLTGLKIILILEAALFLVWLIVEFENGKSSFAELFRKVYRAVVKSLILLLELAIGFYVSICLFGIRFPSPAIGAALISIGVVALFFIESLKQAYA